MSTTTPVIEIRCAHFNDQTSAPDVGNVKILSDFNATGATPVSLYCVMLQVQSIAPPGVRAVLHAVLLLTTALFGLVNVSVALIQSGNATAASVGDTPHGITWFAVVASITAVPLACVNAPSPSKLIVDIIGALVAQSQVIANELTITLPAERTPAVFLTPVVGPR